MIIIIIILIKHTMFLECFLPVRCVTCRILFCPHHNPGRKGLLLLSHYIDEETDAQNG